MARHIKAFKRFVANEIETTFTVDDTDVRHAMSGSWVKIVGLNGKLPYSDIAKVFPHTHTYTYANARTHAR